MYVYALKILRIRFYPENPFLHYEQNVHDFIILILRFLEGNNSDIPIKMQSIMNSTYLRNNKKLYNG